MDDMYLYQLWNIFNVNLGGNWSSNVHKLQPIHQAKIINYDVNNIAGRQQNNRKHIIQSRERVVTDDSLLSEGIICNYYCRNYTQPTT